MKTEIKFVLNHWWQMDYPGDAFVKGWFAAQEILLLLKIIIIENSCAA